MRKTHINYGGDAIKRHMERVNVMAIPQWPDEKKSPYRSQFLQGYVPVNALNTLKICTRFAFGKRLLTLLKDS